MSKDSVASNELKRSRCSDELEEEKLVGMDEN